jgi:hypothetical protein
MKKFLVAILLLLIIATTFSYVILTTQASGSGDNFFNQNYRKYLITNPTFRNILGLHNDGEARYDYLTNNSKIVIEVDSMKGLEAPASALNLLVDRIASITGKDTSYYISDTDIPYLNPVSDKDVSRIAQQYRNYVGKKGTATIYLMYLSSTDQESDELGSTYNESGIIIYNDSLITATANNPGLLPGYFESTALHEFGHQLGLKHNDEPGCLMNPFVERSSIERQTSLDVITDFCDYEKQQIKQMQF